MEQQVQSVQSSARWVNWYKGAGLVVMMLATIVYCCFFGTIFVVGHVLFNEYDSGWSMLGSLIGGAGLPGAVILWTLVSFLRHTPHHQAVAKAGLRVSLVVAVSHVVTYIWILGGFREALSWSGLTGIAIMIIGIAAVFALLLVLGYGNLCRFISRRST